MKIKSQAVKDFTVNYIGKKAVNNLITFLDNNFDGNFNFSLMDIYTNINSEKFKQHINLYFILFHYVAKTPSYRHGNEVDLPDIIETAIKNNLFHQVKTVLYFKIEKHDEKGERISKKYQYILIDYNDNINFFNETDIELYLLKKEKAELDVANIINYRLKSYNGNNFIVKQKAIKNLRLIRRKLKYVTKRIGFIKKKNIN